METQDSNSPASGSVGVKSLLTLRGDIRPEDAGIYQCSMRNPYGADVIRIRLFVQRECVRLGASRCDREFSHAGLWALAQMDDFL